MTGVSGKKGLLGERYIRREIKEEQSPKLILERTIELNRAYFANRFE